MKPILNDLLKIDTAKKPYVKFIDISLATVTDMEPGLDDIYIR